MTKGTDGTRREGIRSRRRGSALIPALTIVSVMVILSMAWVQLSLSKNREQMGAADAKRAFYIAEAGLSEAFIGLASGTSGNVGGPGLPARFANGLFWVEAKPEGDDKVTLTSIGLAGAARVALSVVLENVAESVASLGAFGDERVDVMGGALIDAWDSRSGPYGSGPMQFPPPSNARVGSNQDIVVRDPPPEPAGVKTKILGSARPGPGGSVLRDPNVVITGSTAPREDVVGLPAIEAPPISSSGDVDYTNTAAPLVLPSGDTAYGSLRLQSGTRAVFAGPGTLVVGSLQVDPTAELVLDASEGPIRVFVKDYLHLASGSLLTTPAHQASGVSLLVAAQDTIDRDGDRIPDPPARILSTGGVYASIYAPLAAISIPSTLELFGSVVSKHLTVQANARVHFDLSLIAVTGKDSGLPRLIGWRLVDVPDTPLTRQRYDALTVMERTGTTVPSAPNAHYDVGQTPPTMNMLPVLP